ncbi:MAG TPA: molybdopterin-dependent oxidoreductase [Firmicutes bacterium]|nr:molybdopterin-dependent oxidoreductase [Bacillota bacterium]
MSPVIGQRLPRHDAVLQVTGRSLYGEDIKMPGMLYCKVRRAGIPHARLIEVDTSAAEAIPGVMGVVTAKDVPFNAFGFTHLDQPVMAQDKIRYEGDAIAGVAATSLEVADQAAKAIKIKYEELPAVFDPLEAMKPDAPKVHKDNIPTHFTVVHGDIEKGFAEADKIIEERYTTQFVEHVHIEPHAQLAYYDPTGRLTVWTTVQRPFLVASDLGKVLKMPLSKIRVLTPCIGGGFGGKNEMTTEAIVALLSMKTGRPVKLVFTREEEFTATTVRHPYVMFYKTGVKMDGTITAREVKIISDAGAYVSWGESTLTKALVHAAGPYRIPNVRIEAYLVYTNNNIGGAMRGFGVPQAGYAYECHTDSVARAIGMDPMEFRMKNCVVSGDTLPTGQTLQNATLDEILKKLSSMSGWKVAGGDGR